MVGNVNASRESDVENGGGRLSKEDLKSQLIYDYLKPKLKWPDATKFLNQATEGLTVPATMITELKTRYLRLPTYSSLTEADIDAITYADLLPEIGSEIIEIRSKRQTVKNLILKDYDITSSLYDANVAKKVDAMTQEELNDHINVWELERSELLREVFWKKMPVKRDLLKFFQSFNLVERRKKLSPEKQDQLDTAVTLIRQSNGRIDYIWLEELFEVGIFSADEKKELVTTFIPSISLATALDLWIVSTEESANIQKAYVAQWLKSLWIDSKLKWEKKRKFETAILSKLNTQNLVIDTNQLQDFEAALWKFIEWGMLEKIVDGYNDVIEKVEKNIDEIKNYEDFEEVLWKYVTPLEVTKFRLGSTIVLKQQRQWEEEETFFFEIANNGKKNGNIILKPKWYNTYDKYDSGKVQKESFESLLKVVSWDAEAATQIKTTGFNILDNTDLKQQLKSGAIESATDTLIFENDDEIEKELTRLKEESEERRELLKSKWLGEEEIEEDERIQDIGTKQTTLLNTWEKLESQNLQTLTHALDEIDQNGKNLGLKEWVNFVTKSGDIFTIKQINPLTKQIAISSPAANGWMEVLGYSEFYEAFRDNETKRTAAIKDLGGLYKSLVKDEAIWSIWAWFEIQNDSIEKSGIGDSSDYDFLVSKDNTELLKIDRIVGDMVYVHPGKTKDDPIKENGEIKGKNEIFQHNKKSQAITLGQLENYIKKHKLVPRSLGEKNVKEGTEEGKEDIRSGSFWSRVFKNNLSVFELISGSKLFIENIQSFLKEWTDEKSAQFALDFYGKILPPEVKSDLIARLEWSQKKRMDDYLEKLKAVDSKPATKMIEGWLKNKDVAPYKLEAWVLFMMEKYGVLYAKEIYKYDGSFLWYTALGWKVGDEMYEQHKKQAEDSDQTFSEESLILQLLWEQCKWQHYSGIKRRSRIQKEYKAVRKKGKTDEIAKGKDDAEIFRQVGSRVENGKDELYGWNYPNAIGWIEAIVEKWGSYGEMNKIPFMMAFSWIMYEFDDAVIANALKWLQSKNMMFPITTFMSKTSDMKLMDDTVYEIIKRVDEMWRSKWILADADYVRKLRMKKGEWAKYEAIKAAENFYNTHWAIITDILAQVNSPTKENGGNADLRKMILIEKDAWIGVDGKQRQWNATFKNFYNTNRWAVHAEWSFDVEPIMIDGMAWIWVTWNHLRKAVVQNLGFNSGSAPRKKDAIVFVWDEIRRTIHDTATQSFNGMPLDSFENKALQKVVIRDTLRNTLAWMLDNHGWDQKSMAYYHSGQFAILTKWWIHAWLDLKSAAEYEWVNNNNIDPEEVMNGTNAYFESKMDKWLDNILKVEQWGAIGTVNQETWTPKDRPNNVLELVPKTRNRVDDTIGYREAA